MLKRCLPHHICVILTTIITTKMFFVFFLFICVFNNFVKSYGYCRVNCLEIPVLKVTLVSILVFIYNLLVCSHYCNFIKEFYNLFYLSKLVKNDTKGRYILYFKTCQQIEIKNQIVYFFTKSSIFLNVVILRQILYVDSYP